MTFYNPQVLLMRQIPFSGLMVSAFWFQVDDWSEDLVEIEERAKQNAQLLFFVIDDQTRGVASLVEISYLVATSRPILVVMRDFTENTRIDGRPLTPG